MPKIKRAAEEISNEERERRAYQRAKQQEAIEARSRGEIFESSRRVTFPKRKPLEARKEAERVSRRKAENAAKRRAAQKAVKQQRISAPDIVIVPIFWKGEAKQMARVLSACADVEKALAPGTWRVMLDAGHKYTPGQKFAHWEHKGVKLRVEVGPREAATGCCTIARTFTPSEPARRVQNVTISTEAMSNCINTLSLLQSDQQVPDIGDIHAQPSDDLQEDDNLGVSRKLPTVGNGGDDLGDDFTDVNLGGTSEATKRSMAQESSSKVKVAKRAPPAKRKGRVVGF